MYMKINFQKFVLKFQLVHFLQFFIKSFNCMHHDVILLHDSASFNWSALIYSQHIDTILW